MSNELRFEDFELLPMPVPANETPREFLLRMTGHDFTSLEACSWEYVREYLPMQEWITHVIARLGRPQIILKQRTNTRTS